MSLYVIIYHYISLYIIIYHYISLYIIIWYIHTCMHACMHACIHTYIHTLHYITLHTYIQTLHYITLHYITYIHIYIYILSRSIQIISMDSWNINDINGYLGSCLTASRRNRETGWCGTMRLHSIFHIVFDLFWIKLAVTMFIGHAGSLLHFAALGTDGVAGGHGPLLDAPWEKNPQFHGVHGSGQPFLGRGSLAGVHPRPGQKCWIYLGKLEDGRHRQKVGCYICYWCHKIVTITVQGLMWSLFNVDRSDGRFWKGFTGDFINKNIEGRNFKSSAPGKKLAVLVGRFQDLRS